MKTQKKAVVLTCIVILIFLAFILYCFVNILNIFEYPKKELLTYERCVFIKYEENGFSRHPRYYIYVEEYEKPLEIDNIVFSAADEELLDLINKGSQIRVSIREEKDNLSLYSVEYNGKYILTYDDYLFRHNQNNTIGIIVTLIIGCICVTLLIITIIYYKKTGKNLFSIL